MDHLAPPKEQTNLLPVHLSPEAAATIQQHAETEYPNECCGFLYGVEESVRFVNVAKPVFNRALENRQRRFVISPQDYLNAEQYATLNDLTLLGVYHSHPDHPAVPSIHDFEQAVPFFSYIICPVNSKEANVLRSWQLNRDGRFEEEKISIQSNV